MIAVMITGVTSLLSTPSPPPLRLGVGSYPAGRDPLRLVLHLAHRRQQLDAGVLQLVVDDHMVKELPVLRLDLPGRFFHLLEVFILVEETESQIPASLCDLRTNENKKGFGRIIFLRTCPWQSLP